MAIQIKTLDQLKTMRRAGLLVGHTLELLRESIKVGMRTDALDAIAAANIKRGGGTSNFLGYHGYPATICISINDEIVHGIPGDRVIQDGDVVSIDCGAIIDGWHGDAAFSYGAGTVDLADQKMMDVCEESMWRGFAAAKVGGRLTDISHAIGSYIDSQGKYGILAEYGGHGIGTEMHQEPHVLNFGKPGNGPELIAGLALAIEPMITRGTAKTHVLEDQWTVVSNDHSRGAHFENSFVLLPDGKPYVLTALDGGRAKLATLGVEVSDLLD
jgi:methionyl aminopeptidase